MTLALTAEDKQHLVNTMDFMHRGWRDVVNSVEWSQWLGRQNPVYRENLLKSWDMDEVWKAIEAFHASRELAGVRREKRVRRHKRSK